MHRSDICQCRVDPHMIQDIDEPRTPLDRHHRRSHMLALDLDQDGRGKACGTENNRSPSASSTDSNALIGKVWLNGRPSR